jgi:lipoprotein NlpI
MKCILLILLTLGCVIPADAQDAVDMHLLAASRAIEAGESKQAVEHLDKLLATEPKHATAYYLRGREHFRLGAVKKSSADFDRYVELKPAVESRQWERGIADYYAGNYDKGAKQFALYQTYHDNDVENAVWRYLCMAAAGDHTPEALKNARAELLPIENDRRVPMMQVYAMYRGEMKPTEVLAAAEAGELTARQKNAQLFYAHLYVGLYHAAQGERELEREHILAAEKHKIDHTMWDVAHVHANQLRVQP